MEQLSMFLGLSVLTSAVAFAFAAYLYLWVKKQCTVNEKIIEVSALIKQGANTFMNREYKISGIFAAVLWAVGDASILLGFLYPLLFFKHLDKNRKKPYNLTIFIRRNQDGKNS